MIIDNDVFGKLTYNYSWSRNDKMTFFKSANNIILLVAGDQAATFEELQYQAYIILIDKWDEIQRVVVNSVLDYYKNLRENLGYSSQPNDNYPELLTVEDIVKSITLVGIKVPNGGIYGGRSIGISFDCIWDSENGLGIRLCDETIIDVGYQDIAI